MGRLRWAAPSIVPILAVSGRWFSSSWHWAWVWKAPASSLWTTSSAAPLAFWYHTSYQHWGGGSQCYLCLIWMTSIHRELCLSFLEAFVFGPAHLREGNRLKWPLRFSFSFERGASALVGEDKCLLQPFSNAHSPRFSINAFSDRFHPSFAICHTTSSSSEILNPP